MLSARPLTGRVALLSGKPAELCCRVDAELLHQLRAIRLDGTQADPEFIGDLLVELADNNPIKDLTLAGRKDCQTHALPIRLVARRSPRVIAGERASERI